MSFRGAYIAKLDLQQPHLRGVAAKIRAQVAALGSLPAELELYHLAGGDVICNGMQVASAGKGTFAKRFAHYFLFHVAIASLGKSLDFIYLRHQGSSPMLLWALGRLRRRNPGLVAILELPSWPYHREVASPRERILSWLDGSTRSRLRDYIDRIVTFSRETEILGIPTIATDNGVDLATLDVLPPKPPGSTFRLLGLANLSFWHGYDRVIEGMSLYYANGGTMDLHFDVVGTGTELTRLQHLAANRALKGRVHFHGARHGAELKAIMASADVGISSIGMHRLEVDTSNLKSREFCARGLPFVIGYEDRDFPQGFPFAFHVPANDAPVDLLELIGFRRRLAEERPRLHDEMRDYAERHLSWETKMRPVISYLRESLPGRSRK